MLLPAIALFVLGAIIASFVGVLVARFNTGQGFIAGHSRCDACNKVLPSHALIPIISFIINGGRSHCCGASLSVLSPLTEILLGGLFVLAYMKIGLTIGLFFMLLSLSLLLALVMYDLTHQILPSTFLWIFVATSIITGFLVSLSFAEFSNTVITAFLISLSLAAIHFLSRGRAMGRADAPLVFGLSLLVGPVAFSGFVFSFWIGAVVGIIMLAMRPRGSRMGVEVPFAPFLAAGFLLAYFTQWNLSTLLVVFL